MKKYLNPTIRNLLLFVLMATALGACQNKPEISYEFDKQGYCYEIPKLPSLKVDGDTSDWQQKGRMIMLYADESGNAPADKDLSATFKLGWTEDGLALLVNVQDDQLDPGKPNQPLHLIDGIEIFMAKQRGSLDMVQFMVVPGISDSLPEVRSSKHDFRSDSALVGTEISFQVASKQTDDGYLIEALMPFSNLDVNTQDAKELAFQIYVNDKDGDKKQQLIWHYRGSTYKNTRAMHRICLTSAPSASPVTNAVKAFIEDSAELHLLLSGDLNAETLTVIDSSFTPVKSFKVKDIAHNEIIMPVKPIEGPSPMAIFADDSLLAVLDLFELVYRYVDLEAPNQFEPDIRAFEAQNHMNRPVNDGLILFVGSSSIRMWKSLEKDMVGLKVLNRGFGGSKASDLLHYTDRIVLPYKPDQIVVYEGDNDLASGLSPEEFVGNMKKFIEKVHHNLPDAKIFVLSVKPAPARYHNWDTISRANRMLKGLTVSYDYVTYIDIARPMHDDKGELRKDIFIQDNVHMNAKGYQIWTKTIKPYLMKQ